jgi:hypothetical protein
MFTVLLPSNGKGRYTDEERGDLICRFQCIRWMFKQRIFSPSERGEEQEIRRCAQSERLHLKSIPRLEEENIFGCSLTVLTSARSDVLRRHSAQTIGSFVLKRRGPTVLLPERLR